MKHNRKLLTGNSGRALAAGLFIIAALANGCSRPGDAAKAGATAGPQAVLVNAADVTRAEARRLEGGVHFTGELQPQEITTVNARFGGDISRVLVREGQAVRRAQPLMVFKPRDVKDAAQAAEAELLAAQAGLAAAENAQRRARRLLDAGAASPSDLEVADAALAAAQARMSAAEAGRNRAREDSEKLDVPSPIRGSVSRLFVHSGDRPAVGDPLATVVNTDTLELSATIPSEALGRAAVGTPIRFHVDAFPGEVFAGRVDRLGPTTEPGTRQIRIYSRIPNTDGRLVGGLFAGGRVVDAVKERALAAPVSALRQEGAEQVVYRLRGGRAERIVVRIGLTDEDAGMVELLGQVAEGDSLLTGVLPGIRDGVPVQVLAGTAPAAGSAGATAGTPGAGATAAGDRPGK